MTIGPKLTMKQLEASALKLLAERVLSEGGKMPSEQAVLMAARAMASRAMREIEISQQESDGTKTAEVSSSKIASQTSLTDPDEADQMDRDAASPKSPS